MKKLTLGRYLRALGDWKYGRTALRVALFVGTLLFLINHGQAILEHKMNLSRWISVALTYIVPYLVNVHGQASKDVPAD